MRSISTSHASRAGEETVRNTGKLDPLVDPAEFGVVRRSLVRFDDRPDGTLEMTMGCSMPIECRLDSTGSVGRTNVNNAMKVLPDLYELCSGVLPGYDVHVAIGIFGDCRDQFVLNRPQYEMEADKIVNQLSLMNPENGGWGNGHEDPQYGLFGGAYLVAAYANAIGLKRYDFTISDEPAQPMLSEGQLTRIFGPEVFAKCRTNGFNIDPNDLPTTNEVVQDLLKQAHAFFLQFGAQYHNTNSFWVDLMGPERVVQVPRIEVVPQMQAVIVGLTEGTLALDQVPDFLVEQKLDRDVIKQIQRSVANIPIGAQVPLRQAIIDAGHEIPKAGDVFRVKPDVFSRENLWPLTAEELAELPAVEVTDDSPVISDDWL
ncbi:hypothetical protein KC973_02075 [Candidatus Saccharibacteria bacterium]|nr:hypothetical protein [Candidatus Saccharibacteria bacterium]